MVKKIFYIHLIICMTSVCACNLLPMPYGVVSYLAETKEPITNGFRLNAESLSSGVDLEPEAVNYIIAFINHSNPVRITKMEFLKFEEAYKNIEDVEGVLYINIINKTKLVISINSGDTFSVGNNKFYYCRGLKQALLKAGELHRIKFNKTFFKK